MTDLDQRVRNAIGILADAEPVTTPPVDLVREWPSRAAPPRRSRALVIAISIGVLALAGTAVGATGVLPASITRVFHRISSWGATCHVDASSGQMLASYRLPDGRVFQWWRAIGSRRADGTFATGDDFRIVSPSGKTHDQALACQTIAYGPGRLVLGGIGDTSYGDVIWGQAPLGTTAAVRAVYRDGATAALPLQHGRYFMTAATPPGAIVRVEALAANGAVIATEPNPTNP